MIVMKNLFFQILVSFLWDWNRASDCFLPVDSFGNTIWARSVQFFKIKNLKVFNNLKMSRSIYRGGDCSWTFTFLPNEGNSEESDWN